MFENAPDRARVGEDALHSETMDGLETKYDMSEFSNGASSIWLYVVFAWGKINANSQLLSPEAFADTAESCAA
eukprot:2012805-Amphidinium_carterae.1